MNTSARPAVYRADVRPTPDDLQALAEFLRHASERSEKDLQHLLERHPSLIGALGFCQFISEHAIYKKDENNQTILHDPRRRDRADLIAAKSAPPTLAKARDYKSAHILELKRANLPIASRVAGSRLSDDATHAVEQLKEYERWVTTIPENVRLLTNIGWDVRMPTMTLIMGRDEEFVDNPGQLEELRANLQRQGVQLFTVNDVFRAAEVRIRTLDLVVSVTAWAAPKLVTTPASLRLLVQTNRFQGTDMFAYPPANRPRKHGPRGYTHYRSYLPWLRDEFDFRCAYCLCRETWGRRAESFGIDHLAPKSSHPDLALAYDNLVYACNLCNILRGANTLSKVPTAEDIEPMPDGTLHALNREGHDVIDLFRLNSAEHIEWRKLWMQISELAIDHESHVFDEITSWPAEIPDLRRLSPPGGNTRPAGLRNSYSAQRDFRLA